jgi:predicted short-subunit dehydrogenase-like oxidoreductase (DUF2520 family)
MAAHSIHNAVVIGSGNVATHLALALYQQKIHILQVYSPTPEHAEALAQQTQSLAVFDPDVLNTTADLYLISISDDEIENFSRRLPALNGIVVHTSGITPLSALDKHPRHGVFYPLQTFSKNRNVDLAHVPFCLEASDKKTLKVITALAQQFSNNIHNIPSAARRQLHLAAVLVNNFPMHLYRLAGQLLEENGLDFDLLRPLITETGEKVMEMDPADAQTGPARRGDTEAMEKHLALLEQHPDIKTLYEIISKQIVHNHHE